MTDDKFTRWTVIANGEPDLRKKVVSDPGRKKAVPASSPPAFEALTDWMPYLGPSIVATFVMSEIGGNFVCNIRYRTAT